MSVGGRDKGIMVYFLGFVKLNLGLRVEQKSRRIKHFQYIETLNRADLRQFRVQHDNRGWAFVFCHPELVSGSGFSEFRI
jgi:hypothetical protein